MSRKTSSDRYLSPESQDLLIAALNSNQSKPHATTQPQNLTYTPTTTTDSNLTAPGSGQLDFSNESPFLDFDPDGDFDDSFDMDPNARMIGDLPTLDDTSPEATNGLHEKRKSIEGKDDDDEGGGKRREGEEKQNKKPGRKPLTSEPTTKRKAQNRAAQRAFRERKEQHLKDLETKVEDLEKASETANQENGVLRAQVDRLQVELREYRKRLSWISTNGLGRAQSTAGSFQPTKSNSVNDHNDFNFEFPKFGDLPALPAANLFNSRANSNSNSNSRPTMQNQKRSSNGQVPTHNSPVSSYGERSNTIGSVGTNQPVRYGSLSQSPQNTISMSPVTQTNPPDNSFDGLTGLFSPSILEASRHASYGGYFPQNNTNVSFSGRSSIDNGVNAPVPGLYSNSSVSNTDSPGSSNESHQAMSSIGTSPEPSLSSPGNKLLEIGLNTISEENQFPTFGGFPNTVGTGDSSLNWMVPQSNGEFDPALFGGYREVQDNILSQDFGSFFNEAYPLPDLGSPLHNYNDIVPDLAPKSDLMKQVDAAQEEHEEVVPNNDKPMSCNKIWDRLQSMEKFRNGEIDIDNLCSELRSKAKCSEGGAVVDKKDVDKILGNVR